MYSITTAHTVLDYALTKAAVSGKLTRSVLRVSYKDLMKSIGQPCDKDVELIVTIELAWDETQEGE